MTTLTNLIEPADRRIVIDRDLPQPCWQADESERRDTIEAYEYLAEWEAGQHRGDDGYDAEPILRLKLGGCVRGGMRIR